MLNESICKHNQTGFCKFREKCRKTHENEECQNQSDCTIKECTKRHPKVCRTFDRTGKCRLKEDCAYKHEDQNNLKNEMVEILTKHAIEMIAMQEDINQLKLVIQFMASKIDSYETELQKRSELNKTLVEATLEVEEQYELERDEIVTSNYSDYIHCDYCAYKCQRENTMARHMMNEHKDVKSCDVCGIEYGTNDLLKEHKQKKHSDIKRADESVGMDKKMDSESDLYTEELNETDTESSTESDSSMYDCVDCPEKFKDLSDLISHTDENHKTKHTKKKKNKKKNYK